MHVISLKLIEVFKSYTVERFTITVRWSDKGY
jgi:hypothetical protein